MLGTLPTLSLIIQKLCQVSLFPLCRSEHRGLREEGTWTKVGSSVSGRTRLPAPRAYAHPLNWCFTWENHAPWSSQIMQARFRGCMGAAGSGLPHQVGAGVVSAIIYLALRGLLELTHSADVMQGALWTGLWHVIVAWQPLLSWVRPGSCLSPAPSHGYSVGGPCQCPQPAELEIAQAFLILIQRRRQQS